MCSLGREGSYQLREIVGDATRGKGKTNDAGMLRELGRAMQLGCACSNGRTAPNLVLSGLARFPEEYDAHMRRKKCEALVCERYVTFHILPDLCDGCGECAEACPEDAIEGGRRKIHVIDQDSCEKCGKCFEVCSRLQKAVVKAGTNKPRTPKRPIPVGTWNG
jgi:NADH-quinone oxidoreductase subunit F